MHDLLTKAFKYRAELIINGDEILRLSSGAGDNLPGLIIDKFGKLLVATIYNPAYISENEKILNICKNYFPGVYVIVRTRDNTIENSYQYIGSHQEVPNFIIAEENGLKYEIRFDARDDFGIFRDAAAARKLLAEISKGQTVLNLFAYTSAFGIVGAANGASKIINVDPNKEYLTWAKKNAALNNLDFAVIPDTAQKYLSRQVKRRQTGNDQHFDIIISDPPAFGVGRGADRTLRTYWPKMLEQIADLKPKQIILLCNDRNVKNSDNLSKLLSNYLVNYKVEKIQHTKDVLGADITKIDKWFQPPKILFLQSMYCY